jgi:hypothetical protein
MVVNSFRGSVPTARPEIEATRLLRRPISALEPGRIRTVAGRFGDDRLDGSNQLESSVTSTSEA